MTSKSIINQCVTLLEQGHAAEAEKRLTPLLKQDPENFHALQLFGLSKHLLGQPKDALKFLEKAQQINPNFSAVRHNIAGIYRSMGDMSKAEENFRKAIALKPDYGEAYQGLSEIIRFKNDEPLIEKLLEQLATTTKIENKVYLHFAAGKIFDDCGDYQQAFRHYSLGNVLSKKNWNSKSHTENLAAIRNVFNKDYFKTRKNQGYTSAAPVFIVGMPRSGSTLLEQIISSHPLVFGAGELGDIPSIADQIGRYSETKQNYPQCITDLPVEGFTGMGKAYINRVYSINTDKPAAKISADKNLFNYMHLGLIEALLPEARILHIERHPLDTCLSCYFQNFSKGVHWSFNLKHIAGYYREYRAMMDHWHQVLPNRVYSLKYENLIAQPEKTTRAILAYCSLDWDNNCLNFHKNKRPIKTASVWQVRQPIYNRARGRWHNYQSQIASLIEELKDYCDEYELSLEQ